MTMTSYGGGHLPLTQELRNVELCMQFPSDLKSIDPVIEERRDLVKINASATLAQYLAKETVFGEEIMRLCTPTGSKQRKALPQQELLSIKTAIFKLYPLYWHDPRGFEEMIWAKCHTAIVQACGTVIYKML